MRVPSLPSLEDKSFPRDPAVHCANGEFPFWLPWEKSYLSLQTQAVSPLPKCRLPNSKLVSDIQV